MTGKRTLLVATIPTHCINLIKKVFEIAPREESFYWALQEFLEEYTSSTNRTKIAVTTLPKKTETGNPDFWLWDSKQSIGRYIEAKIPIKKTLMT